MINLILCGGSGTRLWPLSRKLYPKQFAELLPGASLFQETVKRNSVYCERFFIVTNKDLHFLAAHQIESVSLSSKTTYLLEPVGRNTAPAIALACLDLDPEEIVFITPSDHLIENTLEYKNNLEVAEKLAKDGKLVTFGVKPKYPETGYGYIEIDKNNKATNCKVKSFQEKPDLKTAEKYFQSGNYFWNSGMFVFKAGTFLDELKKYAPEVYEKSKSAYDASLIENSSNDKSVFIEKEKMSEIPSISIDYAVMEKSDNVFVVLTSIDWNDLGSFDSLVDVRIKDENNNTFDEGIVSINCKNSFVTSSDKKITMIGVENLIVIDTPDALLLAKKGETQLVKNIVEELQKGSEKDKEITIVHATAHRPWGTYTVLEEKPGFKIKKIVVKPGKRLSLQKHLHRSEHWVVVSGTATITVGEKIILVRKNESVYIPMGEIHRLENEGKIDLVIIESQVGEYLGEDDIIRIEDDYKRIG